MPEPQNRAALDGGTLRLYGTVGDPFDGFDDDTVAELLAGTDGALTVRLNSPGGGVFTGLAIHQMLRERDTTIMIDGLAASIASVIACAGKQVLIAPGAMMMIHNPWNIAMGDAQEMRKSADVLDQVRESLVTIYSGRTGLPRSRLVSMMDDETWLTADEAVALGFADAINEGASASVNDLKLHILPHVPAALQQRKSTMTMTTNTTSTGPSRRERAAAKAQAAEAQAATIRRMVAQAGHDAAFADSLIARGLDVAGAQAAIQGLSEYMAAHIDPPLATHRGATAAYGGHENFPQAAAEALVFRATRRGSADGELARMTIPEIAALCVDQAGKRARSQRPSDIVAAAMTTSDFPAILEDALRKSVRSGMESESATHRQWVRISTAADFRNQKRPILSSAPDLQEVLEHGEYTAGHFEDDGTEFRVIKYGRIVALTFEALLNDDLDAFSRLAPALGLAAVRKEADLVYGLLTANGGDGVTMQDTNPLFHTNHANAVTVDAFDAEGLAAARTALRRQKDISGRGWLNATPRALIVPPELEHAALNLVRQSTVHISSAHNTESAPGWISDLVVVAEPRLVNDAVAYLAASPSQVDHVELATLPDSPEMRQRDGFEVDALQWRIRHAFGVGCLDWRGIVRLTIEPSDGD